MIVGLGADIVNIARIEKTLERFDAHFLEKFFSASEQEDIRSVTSSAQALAAKTAKYFAAKEATAKALGTGFSLGIGWCEIEISHDELGAPLIALSGKALERALEISGQGSFQTLLSLSDDYPFAQAVVILEKI